MISKTQEFSQIDRDLGDVFKALAHPARVAIIKHLAERGTCISGDIAELIPLGRSTVSQHLSQLKEAGLIKGTIDGPRICYCLDLNRWRQFKSDLLPFLESISNSINNNEDCC